MRLLTAIALVVFISLHSLCSHADRVDDLRAIGGLCEKFADFATRGVSGKVHGRPLVFVYTAPDAVIPGDLMAKAYVMSEALTEQERKFFEESITEGYERSEEVLKLFPPRNDMVNWTAIEQFFNVDCNKKEKT